MGQESHIIDAPADFVPRTAISYGEQGGLAVAVSRATPLPIASVLTAASAAPLTGTLAASGEAGPFAAEAGRPIVVTLAGNWTGNVQMTRSRDGGATRQPLTYADGSAKGAWSGNVNAAVHVETVAGATFYLAVTLTGGTLSYRMEQ